jgi:hypothetical protein
MLDDPKKSTEKLKFSCRNLLQICTTYAYKIDKNKL